MALLAGTNPENDGRISDDGFVIGRFDLGGTVQLLAFSLQVGLVATACYLVARQLVIGPRWFQVASMAVGAGASSAALIIHPDGIDFTAFDPPGAADRALRRHPRRLRRLPGRAGGAPGAVRLARSRTDARWLALITLVLWAIGRVTLILLLVVVGDLGGLAAGRRHGVGSAVRSQVARWSAGRSWR